MEVSFIRPAGTVFIVGPGTVVSVHLLDLPYVEPHYAVKYKTDGGELIEVWTPGKGRFGARRDARDTDLLHSP